MKKLVSTSYCLSINRIIIFTIKKIALKYDTRDFLQDHALNIVQP